MIKNSLLKEYENECTELIYEVIDDYYIFCNNELAKIDEAINELTNKISSNLEIYRDDKEKLKEDCLEVDLIGCEIFESCGNHTKALVKKVHKYYECLTLKVMKSAASYKEMNVLKFRISSYCRAIDSTIESFIDDIYARVEQIKSDKILEFVKFASEEVIYKFNNRVKYEIEEEKEKLDISRSDGFNYKEVIKLAVDNGYEYKWSRGSHNIYEHKNTNKIVVIPTHTLGLGLSKKIQKQILENAA